MYLARSVEWNGEVYRMSGVLPINVNVSSKPRGHGYCEALVEAENPYFKRGGVIKGHELHNSSIVGHDAEVKTALRLKRGVGCFEKGDGLIYKSVFASYMHLHATSCPEWVSGMIVCARKYRDIRKGINREGREDSRKGLEERPVPQLSRV
jgi:cobyrinic acid a,c-diamide synthase